MRSLDIPTAGHNEPDRIIGTIRKNAQEDIAVALRSYKGTRFCDMRVMARRPDGEPVPTAKGVTIKPEALREMIELLRKAHTEAIAAGWCGGEIA
jgi:predicted alpha/beta-hydrolase family hydrolase